MRLRGLKRWAIWTPALGVVLAIAGVVYALRHAEAVTLATWVRALEQTRDESRMLIDARLDAGRMTARLAAGYPTALYLAEGRTGSPRPFPAADGPASHLAHLLVDLCREGGYLSAVAVAPSGALLAATPGVVASPDDLEVAQRAIATGEVALALSYEAGSGTVRYAAAIHADAPSSPRVAAVVVREDANVRLFAAIRRRERGAVAIDLLLVARTPDGVRVLSPPPPTAVVGGPEAFRAPSVNLAEGDGDADHSESGTDLAGRDVLVAHGRLRSAPWTLVGTVLRAEVAGADRAERLSLALGGVAAILGLVLAIVGLQQHRAASERARNLATAGRLQLALDRGDDVALFLRADGTVGEARGAVRQVYGMDAAALVGRSLVGLRPDRLRAGPVRTAPSVGIRVEETLHVRADGRELPVELSHQGLDDGGDIHAIVRVRDITERRRTDERLQALNRLLRMRSSISHALLAAADRATAFAVVCNLAIEQGGIRVAWVGAAASDGTVGDGETDGRDPGGPRLVPIASAVADPVATTLVSAFAAGTPRGLGAIGRAVAQGHPVAVDDVAADAHCGDWVTAAQAAGVRSVVAVPFGGTPGGAMPAVFVLHAADVGAFAGDVLDVATSIAADLTAALDRIAARAAERDAVERLRASDAVHRLLFEANPSPMWVYDRATYRILRVNDAAVAQYGWSRAEFHAMSAVELRPAEDRARFLAYAASEIADHERPVEWQHLRKDGTIFPVSTVCSSIEFLGRPARLVLIEDLTARRRAEVVTQTLVRAVEQSPVSIVITDREGRIEYVNPNFCRASGYAAEEVLGRNPRILKSGRTSGTVYAKMWSTVLAGGTWRGELSNRRKDGQEFAEMSTIAPVFDGSGAITHFVAVKEDLTDRRAMEARAVGAETRFLQAQKLEAVGRLAGGVAHDFNNLLCVILGYAQMVATTLGTDHPEAGKLEQVVAAATRAEGLTRQLLAYSRRQILQPRVVDLHEVVRGFEKMLRRLIGEDVELVTRFDAPSAVVLVDPGQLEQVILNLTVNARDAMPNGGRVTLSTHAVDVVNPLELFGDAVEPGPWVVLDVEDDGTGMDDATLGRLFEPFFTTKPTGQGTGLGLATVQGIVRQSGGHVDVRSALGEGTTISVYLPRFAGVAEGLIAEPVDLRPFGGHETVLVVEDQDGVRELVRAWLEGLGYAVVVAKDGVDALEVVDRLRRPVDLVLTDVVMPRMSGRETSERLLARWPQLRVVYMSGYTSDVIARQGVLEPGVRLLEKPLTQASLARMVRETLDAPR